jgi:hypothetical protein
MKNVTHYGYGHPKLYRPLRAERDDHELEPATPISNPGSGSNAEATEPAPAHIDQPPPPIGRG